MKIKIAAVTFPENKKTIYKYRSSHDFISEKWEKVDVVRYTAAFPGWYRVGPPLCMVVSPKLSILLMCLGYKSCSNETRENCATIEEIINEN